MAQFINSFCLTLLHSLWQALVLWGLYKGFRLLYCKQSPGFYRNLLFLLLSAQLVVSVISFVILYTGSYSITGILSDTGNTNLHAYTPYLQKIAPWIFTIYSTAVLYKCCQVIIRWRLFRKECLAEVTKPSPELKVFTTLRSMEFGIGRKVKLWYSNRIHTPLTFGYLKPVILLPVALVNNLSTKETESLILHELTHIKTNDYLLNWFLIFSDHVFFFNPFTTFISREICVQRELQCDVQVLRFYNDQLSYADTLLKTARFASQPLVFQLAAAGRNRDLLQRIRFFTGSDLEFRSNRHAGFTGFFLLMAAVTFTLFGAANIRQSSVTKKITTVQVPVTVSSKATEFDREVKSGYAIAARPAGVLINLTDPDDDIEEDNKSLSASVPDETPETVIDEPMAYEVVDAPHSIEENIAFPVAALETENEKEIIVKEEISGSNETISRAYKMTYKDGEWVPELMWILTEQKPVADSSGISADIKSVFPSQQ